MATDIEKLEDDALYIDDSAEVPPADIVAFNELRSCADLYRMHQQGILQIQPKFQRDIVWQGPDQTRFIDSLVKQLPIPSMCFAQDYKKQEWIVIDGLQRIATIIRFLDGGDWKLAKLDDIDPVLAGKSVAGLTDILYQRDRETIAWLPPDPEGLGTGLMSGVPAVCNPAMSAV